ncbi:DUF397 domain-containing protein [Streptomyces sp. SBT349]|uniref:DUF397 domain-containing protein n=1 Tax=Streptomyces sp. SBT349 TaxID=1580539 RepID=UPI0007C71496|nr:DUF397 domain-containing protein [Streptomyces sp. SBT349]
MNRSDPPCNVRWFTSSHSNGNGECVEVAALDGAVALRDSKRRGGHVLVCTPTEWHAFLTGVAHDELGGRSGQAESAGST